jgi:hypothetical protein
MVLDRTSLEKIARETGHELTRFQEGAEVLVIGKEYGNDCSQVVERQVIELLNPSVVLVPEYDVRWYNGKKKTKGVRRRAPRNDLDNENDPVVEAYLKLADEFGFKLVGCDLTYTEKERIGENKLEQSDTYNQQGLRSKNEDRYIERVIEILEDHGIPRADGFIPELDWIFDPERHEEMAKTVARYKNATPGPLLMIVGKYHTLDSTDYTSSLHKELEQKLGGETYAVMEIERGNIKEARS